MGSKLVWACHGGVVVGGEISAYAPLGISKCARIFALRASKLLIRRVGRQMRAPKDDDEDDDGEESTSAHNYGYMSRDYSLLPLQRMPPRLL